MHELKGINGEPPSADDFLDVKDCALITERIVNALDHVAQFNLGDYLVARTDNKDYVRDAYGSVIKYRVLYIDKLGFPYIKRLSKNGRPTGFLYSMLDFSQLDYSDTTNLISVVPSNNSSRGSTLTYMIDPDYADAIIMGDIENYDPCAVLKSKSKLHREIAKHNKSISIRIDNPVKLNKFISNHIKVGASIWRSVNNCLTILEVYPKYSSNSIKGKYVARAINSLNKEVLISRKDLCNKVFYTARPRSYKELKDPNI